MWTDVLLVAGFAWLLVLTLLLAGLVRYVGAMQAAGTTPRAPEGGFLPDTDGPWIPSEFPDRARKILRSRGIGLGDLTVTFFSSSCGPCVERATQIAQLAPDPGRNMFLVTGANPGAVTEMSRILEPTDAPVLRDPEAQNIVKALQINSTPFTIRVVSGQIVAKAYVRGVADYRGVAEMTAEQAQQQTSAVQEPVPVSQSAVAGGTP